MIDMSFFASAKPVKTRLAVLIRMPIGGAVERKPPNPKRP